MTISLRALLAPLLGFVLTSPCSGNIQTDPTRQFSTLEQAHKSRQLSDEAYLKAIDSLTSHLLSAGVFFPVDTLLNHLKHYQDIAWSHSRFGPYRVDYYLTHLNNAHMADLRGASIYFAEKVTQEGKRQGEPRPLIELAQKAYIFSIQKNYHKIIGTYERGKGDIQSVLATLKADPTDYKAGMDAFHILSPVITAYANLKDTAGVIATFELASNIAKEIKSRYPIKASHMLLTDFALLEFEFALASFRQDYDEAERIMNNIERLKQTYAGEASGFIDYNLTEWRTGQYLHVGNLDSASHYVGLYESMPVFSESQQAVINTYKAKLAALRGDYRLAYELIEKALQENGKAQSGLMEEIDQLLYAFTESEANKIALELAEKGKRQRTWLIVAVSLLALTSITIVTYRTRKRDRSLRLRIEKLNETANLQVTAMEEITSQAVREEQKRLARDLHDSLSTTLAGIKHQLDLLTLDNPTNTLTPTLAKICNHTNEAYAIARGKSHQWFEHADSHQEAFFRKRVQMILDTVLPDDKYTKNIEIDEETLNDLTTEKRIELLRIIQEAITNTIKHATAKTVSVLLYREEHHLVLAVSDDGKTRSKRGLPGLGIRSMRERVDRLGGILTIQSTDGGTEVLVTIPLS